MSLPALAVGASTIGAQGAGDCADSAKTSEDVKKSLPFPAHWVEAEYDGRKLLLTLSEGPGDPPSYIDIHGWVYNEPSREWRRFLKVGTRHISKARLVYDPRGGAVSVVGAADNEFKGAEVLRFDLRAVGNDAT